MNKKIIITGIALLASFAVMKFMYNTLFIANTPLLNPNLQNQIMALEDRLKGKPTTAFKQPLSAEAIKKITENLPLKQVVKGVYAGQDRENGVTFYKMTQDVKTKTTYFVTPDGVRHTILVPVDESTGK